MDYSRQTARLLHDEHNATIHLLDRLGGILASHQTGVADANDPAMVRFLADLDRALEGEIGPHFEFEESKIFNRLIDSGDTAIVALLKEEHEAILPLAASILRLTRSARANGFTASSWGDFLRQGNELIDRLTAHIHKEDMALLPLLDDLLDHETDFALASLYVQSR